MAKKFLTDINIAGGVYDSSGDIGSSGQVLSSTGSGINWIDANSAASVVYQDGFTGNGSTTAFTLANSIDNENKTQVYIDGVYQHKDNYSLSGTTLTFSTAPPNSSDIEVISFGTVSSADDILYDTDFTSAGLMTTNGAGVYSITTNNSSNWNTAYTYSQVGHLPLAGGTLTGNIEMGGNSIFTQYIKNNASVRIDIDTDNNQTDRIFVVSKHNAGTELFRINESGNVGIGLTNPAVKLEIQDSTHTTMKIRSGNNDNILFAQAIQSNDARIGTDTNTDLSFYSNASERMRINSSGNVGIGTTSPSTTLETAGIIQTTGNGASFMFEDRVNSGNKWEWFSAYNKAGLYKNHNTAETVMTIDSSGRVGIGTTSPDTKLNIEGVKNTSIITLGSTTNDSNWTAGDKIGGINFYSADGSGSGAGIKGSISYIATSSSGGSTAMIFNTADSSTNDAERVRIDANGKVGIGTTSPSELLHVNGSYKLGTNGFIEYGATYPYTINIENTASAGDVTIKSAAGYNRILLQPSTSGIDFYTGNSEKMRITSGGDLCVGVTAALGRIHMHNSGTSYFHISNSTTGSGSGSGTDIGIFTGQSDLQINNREAASVIISTSDTPRMTINSSGNVGIGDTTPDAKLDVELAATNTYDGTALNTPNIIVSNRNSSNVNSQASIISLRSTGWAGSTTGVVNLAAIQAGNASSAHFAIQTRNGGTYGERMRITSAGKVGIGTTSPNKALTVYGGNDNGIWIDSQGAQYTSLAFGHNGSEKANIAWDNTNGYTNISTYSNGHLALTTGGSISAFLNYNGDFGIGTTSPTTRLSITDGASMYANSNYLVQIKRNAFNGNDDTSKASILLANKSNAMQIAYGGSTDRLRFIDGGAVERFTMLNGGNVGIGTTSPSAALQIGSGAANVLQKIWGSGTAGIQIFTNSPSTGTKIIALEQYFSNEGFLGLYYNGAEKVRFRANDSSFINGGNVGIGTTSPRAKLEVNGELIAEDVKHSNFSAGTISSTGVTVATVTGAGNGASAQIEFIGMGGTSGIVDVVYSCTNQGGNWYAYKKARQTPSIVDVDVTGHGTTTLTFVFKALSSNGAAYTPRLMMKGSPTSLVTF